MKKQPTSWIVLLSMLIVPTLLFAGGQKDAAKPGEAAKAGPAVVTMFYPIDPKSATTLKSYADMMYFQEMEKRTGVKLDFKHPPAGQETEQFNLLMASNTLPDMVYWWWTTVPGGPGKPMGDGQIAKLNDLIDQYAPNFKKTMTDNTDWRKQVVLDDGSFYMFPKIKKDPYLLITNGFQVREDWLKKLDIKPPKTMQEWYSMLSTIKKSAGKNGIPANVIPYTGYGSTLVLPYTSPRKFAYAWGVIVDFYMDGKTVKFGPIQPAYKEYLAEMRKWYAEGLLDPDFVSQDVKGFEAKVVGNRAASYAGLVNGHMGKFMGLKKNDPEFSLIGLPFPVGPAGKSYGDRNWNSTGQGIAVSAKCVNKAAAMKWGDYMYTPDGIMLANFGVEGLTYKMVNGRPVYTDLIMNNPDKLPVINALSKYLLVSSNGVLVQIEDSFRAMHDKRQQTASEGYINSTDPALVMPPTQPAPKQAEVLGSKMNDIYTHVDEMFNKFIMGAAPLEDFDKYVATIKKMGIDEAAAIWQDAADKYSKR